ncbi:metallophosphoesterase family protein [Rurimicrobium arvi]|uniref:Metallophosphoesterase family protein n=1 Tax=Rurimicrobium arvi TaxID=2049916 RepID=A0ABP8MDG4_9BACT
MKIALFSDIHANLPALEAMFRDMEQQAPDAVYCLGDLVGYNVWPNEVVQEIRRRGIPVIAGNYDSGVGRNSDDCGCAYKSEEEKINGSKSIAYTNAVIGEAERAYLRMLPAHIRIGFQLNEKPLQILLAHGSPRRINEYLFEDRDEKSLLRILRDAGTDVLCVGHTHKPYHRVIEDGEGSGKFLHVINVGSVGKPKDGDPRGCYAILHLTGEPDTHDGRSIVVRFCRFEYDVERAASGIEESVLPATFAQMLRTGI